MTKLQAIKKSIKHWEKMIKWAKEKTSYSPYYLTMKDSIGESWFEGDCPLCKKYMNDSTRECFGCPLGKKYGVCGTKSNKWLAVYNSSTWGIWVLNANKLLRQLRSLLPKKGK